MGEISVLFISHERKMGGANLSLFELACEMKKKGAEVLLLSALDESICGSII